MITKVATFRGVSQNGEPLVQVFHRGDSIAKLAGTMVTEVQEWLASYTPSPNKIAVLVNALGASEYWGQNINGDIFYESALLHDCRGHTTTHPIDDFTGKIIPPYGYWTFYNAHPFVHHRNKDPSRAFGNVALACWNSRMHRVELVVLLDRALAMQHGAQHVVDKIDAGEFGDVSMGCRVPFDVCTICNNKSKTRNDYCKCIKDLGMGKLLPDGRRIGVINTYPRFFDISFVFIGADKTAKVMCKLASGIEVPFSVAQAYEIYNIPENSEGLVKAACGSSSCTECAKGCSIKAISVNAGPNYGRTDNQAPKMNSAIRDGTLRTNFGEDGPDYLNGGQNIQKNAEISQKGLEALDAVCNGAASDLQITIRKRFEGEIKGPGDEILATLDPNSMDKILCVLKLKHPDHPLLDQIKTAGSLESLFELAKKIPIAPPPNPNRKEYPFIGSINFRGLIIHVENKPGDTREGVDPSGKKWRTEMRLPYGEFVGTLGSDKDKLDVYVGPYRDAANVYIIHQNHVRGPKSGKYDEDKVMVGFLTPEQAKEAYLSHYDNPKYLRSFTTMAFPLFKKALERKEVHGEKVAETMKKIAQDLQLEDLFSGHHKYGRRHRVWRSADKETVVVGSGMGSFDKVKEAASPFQPLSPQDLLKVSNDSKIAAHLKWADIVKNIGPDRAVGRVSPALSLNEPTIPKETLNEMGRSSLEESLSTPSLMGMVLKPREFQRICLVRMGKEDLADSLDSSNTIFRPNDTERAPCGSLSSDFLGMGLLKKLLPLLSGKSYFGPIVKRRIIQITITEPEESLSETEVDSPLLSKVASAYTWYRREQMKLAADAINAVSNIPELHAGVYGITNEDLFSKSANAPSKLVSPATLAVLLGAIPITLMYSAHLRSKKSKGGHMGLIKSLVADHPWLTTLGTAAGLREIMKTPQAQQAVTEALSAGKRIWRGASV